MRIQIIKSLLHFAVHNSGRLPSEVVVSPVWANAVREFMAQLGLQIIVRADAKLSDHDVSFVAQKGGIQ